MSDLGLQWSIIEAAPLLFFGAVAAATVVCMGIYHGLIGTKHAAEVRALNATIGSKENQLATERRQLQIVAEERDAATTMLKTMNEGERTNIDPRVMAIRLAPPSIRRAFDQLTDIGELASPLNVNLSAVPPERLREATPDDLSLTATVSFLIHSGYVASVEQTMTGGTRVTVSAAATNIKAKLGEVTFANASPRRTNEEN